MDYLESLRDVDAFMDKIGDPVNEVGRILNILDLDDTEINRVFIHKLLIKAYRLGKDHGYASSVEVIRGQ